MAPDTGCRAQEGDIDAAIVRYPRALVKVMVPVMAPAFLTSGLFTFLASMDNFPISIILTYARNLPPSGGPAGPKSGSLSNAERSDTADRPVTPGGTVFRFFQIAPEGAGDRLDAAERERRTAEAFAAMGAAHARVDTARHPAMHKTATVDAPGDLG